MQQHSRPRNLAVCAVIVTYGNRFQYLDQVIRGAYAAGVNSIVVVDNCSSATTRSDLELLSEGWPGLLHVLRLPTNSGSAGGYKAGLEFAVALPGTEMLWLLDDDNVPCPDALDVLVSTFHELVTSTPRDKLALLSHRPAHQQGVAMGVPIERCYPRPGSFLGFHLADAPYKIWKRTSWGRPRNPPSVPKTLLIPFGQYGGLFFHYRLIKRIGLPLADMVLYADDLEFSARVAKSGGKLFLVTGSRIKDVETSWNVEAHFHSSFERWICGGSDFQAYYGARNEAFFEKKLYGYGIQRYLNRTVYFGGLALVALKSGNLARLRLLFSAIRDGEAECLGINPKLPLL